MKTIIAALALTVAASTGAFAQSSALDAQTVAPVSGPVAIANGVSTDLAVRDRLGDGSPMYEINGSGVDFTATASIGGASANFNDNRLYFGSN